MKYMNRESVVHLSSLVKHSGLTQGNKNKITNFRKLRKHRQSQTYCLNSVLMRLMMTVTQILHLLPFSCNQNLLFRHKVVNRVLSRSVTDARVLYHVLHLCLALMWNVHAINLTTTAICFRPLPLNCQVCIAL